MKEDGKQMERWNDGNNMVKWKKHGKTMQEREKEN